MIDSGCSDHEVRKLKQPFVVDVANDGVSLIGEYRRRREGTTKEGVRFEMKNVVFLPDLRGNLLSVKKLSKAGIDVLFTRQSGTEKAVMKHTCVLGKQCREPFDGTRARATRPLERVHSDVCGPIDPPAWDGSRYFVSFIDDFTHFAVIYPIKKKSDVFDRFQGV
ncbi:uncharacterized protein LOC134221706 [Armigeres subalbatus]|uniref:uncharacterized protein LOC134221706 n=1 Tax=Armigeres subalbatus TaxID=124917 RepID=UPI002ED2C549